LHRKPSDFIKDKVAMEAALLLYTQQEKEFKQAKRRAAKTLASRMLPSNKDIAQELDKIADDMEGPARKERLAQMRKSALSIMVMLGEFHPRLVGSVWRGTSHKNSDIDIEVFTTEHAKVLGRLKQNSFLVRKAELQSVTKGNENEKAFHIYLALPPKYEVELVVRDPEKIDEVDMCETYGDPIKGLRIHQLRRILLINPTQKFVPT